MAVQLRFVLTASIWLTSSLMSIIFNVMARVVALSAASSRLSVISVVVYVMMVVMNCLRESAMVSFARVVRSTVDVVSLAGRMDWIVRMIRFLSWAWTWVLGGCVLIRTRWILLVCEEIHC